MKSKSISELLAVPLQSAVRAQTLATREALSVISEIGMDGDTARTFRLRAPRVVEEATTDPATGKQQSHFVERPVEMNVPLLTMIALPNMQMSEMNVEFDLEVLDTIAEDLPGEAAGTLRSLASSPAIFAPRTSSSGGTMKVSMRIVPQVPEGLARVGDILNDLISGRPAEPIPPGGIGAVPGIGAERARLLGARNISIWAAYASQADAPRVDSGVNARWDENAFEKADKP